MRPEEHQAYSFEDERKRIKACFCAFVEGSLVSHDIDAVLQLFCDDVIGIGMGAQGIVRRESGDDFAKPMRRFTSARKRSAAMATRSTAMAPIPEQKTGLEQKRRFLFQACPV